MKLSKKLILGLALMLVVLMTGCRHPDADKFGWFDEDDIPSIIKDEILILGYMQEVCGEGNYFRSDGRISEVAAWDWWEECLQLHPDMFDKEISGVAWYDENANGIRDPHEALLKNVQIEIKLYIWEYGSRELVRQWHGGMDYEFVEYDEPRLEEDRTFELLTDVNGAYGVVYDVRYHDYFDLREEPEDPDTLPQSTESHFYSEPRFIKDGDFHEVRVLSSSTITERDVGEDDTVDSDVGEERDSDGGNHSSIAGYSALIDAFGGVFMVDVGLLEVPEDAVAIYPNTEGPAGGDEGEMELGLAGQISDFVWQDLNENGLQDQDEIGVPEVEVMLYDSAGDEVAKTITDADGLYLFEDVSPGDYTIAFAAPEDYLFTLKDEGDDGVDSDADDTGMTDVFILLPDEDKSDVDAGLVMPGAAAGATCPLTGLPIDNPDDLDRRPIGMSISHFPPEATRPPTGINWAPFVYEIFTGDGQTRLFAIFYCGYPSITLGLGGEESAPSNNPAVGNWVWGDVNANGIQDKDEDGNNLEPGVPEITVKLFEQKGTFVAETETDEYGYYFFDNVAPGKYYITFNTGKTGYEFTDYQVPDDPEVDSDALANGVTAVFEVTEGYVDDIDAGMVIVVRIEGVRSGRVLYVDIIKYFGGGLIYQGADPRVEAVIGNMKCASASSSDSSNIGSGGIDVTRLADVADECQVDGGNTDLNVYQFGPIDMDYQMADEFMMFYNIFNRTHWVYDEGLGGYVRYQNSINEPEVFTMSTDKMSGDPVARANVIVLFTKHSVLNSAGTIIDISLDYQEGNARLFRDGMMYKICWDTQPGSYPTESNRLRPVLFTDCNGNIIPLAPGSTWINVVDVTAAFYFDDAKGWWYARFYAPQYTP